MTESVFPKVFAKDLSNLFTLVAWATSVQLHGSYSDRHPNLGKMRKCPHCGKRRREFGQRCCNAKYSTTRRVWDEENGFQQEECPERVTAAIISKKIIKNIIRKKHGQTRQFKIRELTKRLQGSETFLEETASQMCVPKPGVAAIPPFSEKYFYWLQERRDKKVRRQQDRSRRINVGLCSKSR